MKALLALLLLLQTTPSSVPRSSGCCGFGSHRVPRQSSLLDGLTSYWTLDESSAGASPVTRADSRLSNDVTDSSSIASTTGILGNGVACNGAKYLVRLHNASNLTGDQPFAVSGWFNLTAGVWHEIIFAKGNEWYFRLTQDGYPDFATNHVDHASLLIDHYDGWHFFYAAYNKNAGLTELRIDSNLYKAVAITSAVEVDPTSNLEICAGFTGGQPSTGTIDELGYWIGRVLTPVEQECLYGNGTPPAYPFVGVCDNN